MNNSATNFDGQPKRVRNYLRPEDVTRDGSPKARHLCQRSHFEKRRAATYLTTDTREAVLRTVPKTAQQFAAKLHTFARHLRNLMPSESAAGHLHTLRVWFFLAQPVGGRKWPWPAVLKLFARIYPATETAKPFRLDRIAASAADPSAASITRRVTVALAAIGRRIGRTFFASVRSVAKWAGTSSATAGRVLDSLIHAGSVRVVHDAKPDPINRDARVFDVGPLLALSDRFPDAQPIPHATAPEPSRPCSHPVPSHRGGTGNAREEAGAEERVYPLVSHDDKDPRNAMETTKGGETC